MSTALERVNTATGEVATVAEFSMSDYLASVSTPGAIQTQQKLAAAYDTACASLIGPNDVQVEGTRSFKKKSAWRKLARHFTISTDITKVEREILSDGSFLATAIVRARAPWGQSAEAVGACCQDEAIGKRVITIADAIATAETRATNRAVSNLIAMGEVSAEEMSGKPSGDRPVASSAVPRTGPITAMPFGKHKGKPWEDVPSDDLQSTLDWCVAKKKDDVAAACRAEIERRSGGNIFEQGEPFDEGYLPDDQVPF